MLVNNKSSQQQIKEANIKLVFRLIHKLAPISRADIKKITGLSATTVSSLVEELIAEHYVMEQGMKDSVTSGRKAVLLEVCPEGGTFVALDVRESNVSIDSYRLDFSPLSHIDVPVVDGVMISGDVVNAVRVAGGGKVMGVVIGSPYVDYVGEFTPTNVLMEEIARIHDAIIQNMPDIPVTYMHDAGLMAYAEAGIGDGIDNLVLINLHEGISAGVILDNKLRLADNGAGRVGHMSVDPAGEKCWCGNRGCLELSAGVITLYEKTGCKSLEEICERYDAGDKAIIDAVQCAAEAIAISINNIVLVVGVGTIVLSGKLCMLGDRLLVPLKEYFAKNALRGGKGIHIGYSRIEGNAVTLGGAKMLFDQLFGE